MAEHDNDFFKGALQRLPGNHFLSVASVSSLLGVELRPRVLSTKIKKVMGPNWKTDLGTAQLFQGGALYFPSAAVNAQNKSASLRAQKHEAAG
eukprot:CAMPEP_0171913908 /NCGR_PEP_ID=MMETSP0993-20121228/12148_1 /TAXON_ID=483369 /ORGANISM="non described non described, Strain CCMP2098" /LENGTH=92 /DNA_ID=CAMNT_0012548065 /DNA_START=185 /DNA_END=460 /DNA_ORIENTATION=+